jgi:hypothetical protein
VLGHRTNPTRQHLYSTGQDSAIATLLATLTGGLFLI